MKTLSLTLLVSLAACGGDMSATSIDMTPSPFIEGFAPAPVASGYTRYITPIIKDIPAGTDVLHCEWLQAPLDHDTYVSALTEQQSKGGHHIVLYGNKVNETVGTSRECTSSDMLSITFVGAGGGEGTNTKEGALPPGVVFLLPKGMSLMSNTHYINATQAPIDGQGVVDVKYVDFTAGDQIANLFANVGFNFTIPAQKTSTYDVVCPMQADVAFFQFANHMHTWGTAVDTDLVHLDGTIEQIIADSPWLPEEQFNFRFQTWPIATPKVIRKGETLRTHCTWRNTTGKDMTFPQEMCAGFGYFLSPTPSAPTCVDGAWSN